MSFLFVSLFVFSFSDQAMVGPNLDLSWVWQSDAAPFRENYAKLYFDAEHLRKGIE